jgi:Ataxin-3
MPTSSPILFSEHCGTGYSVFTIISSTEDAHILTLLPRCEADALAPTLPDPSGMQYSRLNMTRSVSGSERAVPASLPRGATRHSFEDEDLELQAALQASLLENSGSGSVLPPQLPLGRPQPSSLFSATLASSIGADPNDPVAASMARNRAALARMQQEQAMALREGYVDEVARAEASMHTRRRPAVPAGLLLEVDPDEGDDDDDLDYFDPEDDDYANAGRAQRGPPQMFPPSHILSSRHNRVEDDEEEAEVEDDVMTVDDDADWPVLRRFDTPRADPLFPPPSPALAFAQPGEEEEEMDADLAAAIKASLEEAGMDVPEDVRERAATSGLQSRQELAMPRAGYAPNQGSSILFDGSDPESPVQEDAPSEPIPQALPSPPPQQQQQPPPPPPPPPPQSEAAVSVDELRRRRLARFGA